LATWGDLGAWNIETASLDLTDRVLARVADQEDQPNRPVRLGPFKSSQLRIAASIALAAGLGVAAGAMVPSGETADGSHVAMTPTTADVAESLGLTGFATDSATGLPFGLEPESHEKGDAGDEGQ